MYGTLAGALAGRKIAFDREQYSATVDGRIEGLGRTIRITSIVLHYDLVIAAADLDAAERALRLHPAACPAHESVSAAIPVSWDAIVHAGDQLVRLTSETATA